MKVGDIVYINAINLSNRDINTLKHLLWTGCLAPVQDEIRKVVAPTSVGDFISGSRIFPQMDYIKLQ